eukprot:scaffold10353_cov122-Skeletonema_dohrnii-CCMP3373.AAC.2
MSNNYNGSEPTEGRRAIIRLLFGEVVDDEYYDIMQQSTINNQQSCRAQPRQVYDDSAPPPTVSFASSTDRENEAAFILDLMTCQPATASVATPRVAAVTSNKYKPRYQGLDEFIWKILSDAVPREIDTDNRKRLPMQDDEKECHQLYTALQDNINLKKDMLDPLGIPLLQVNNDVDGDEAMEKILVNVLSFIQKRLHHQVLVASSEQTQCEQCK